MRGYKRPLMIFQIGGNLFKEHLKSIEILLFELQESNDKVHENNLYNFRDL